MEIRDNLKYLPSHEWVETDGTRARIGITDYAQHELGDIVYVELPAVGDEITADAEFANVESVKAVSPIISPVSGKVTAVNEEVDAAPETVNERPYDAWFVEVEVTVVSDELMSAEQYRGITG